MFIAVAEHQSAGLSSPSLLFYISMLLIVVFSMQGVITTRKNLDREAPGLTVDADERGVYTLTVEAADHGSPVQRTTATVNIKQLVLYKLH